MHDSIPFGLDPITGKTFDSKQVKRGLACGCVCPECNAPLVAVQGKKNRSHFRHAPGTKNICIHPVESSIHLKAKQLFSEINSIILPKVSIKPGNMVDEIIYSDARDFSITRVETEFRKDGNDVIPDLALYSANEKVYVEILYTHAVDDEKIEKLHKRGIPTLEIDLGKDKKQLETLTEEELKDLLFRHEDNKKWVYIRPVYELKQRVCDADHLRYTFFDGLEAHVKNCPLNYVDEYSWEYCGDCMYCISVDHDEDYPYTESGTIICSARAGFSLKNSILSKDEIHSYITDIHEKRKKNKALKAAAKQDIEEKKEVKRPEVIDLNPTSKSNSIIKQHTYKCIKCHKVGEKDLFKSMRISEQEPICDDCILNSNYDAEEASKIINCPKCGTRLVRQGNEKRCASYICGWSLLIENHR